MSVNPMRNFIRHPVSIPIEIDSGAIHGLSDEVLNDISYGGLKFFSHYKVPLKSVIHMRIPLDGKDTSISGRVVWCKPVAGKQFEIGVEFMGRDDAFRIRMVEQVCHIYQYMKDVAQNEHRKLNFKQASMEWIEKFAHEFPQWDE